MTRKNLDTDFLLAAVDPLRGVDPATLDAELERTLSVVRQRREREREPVAPRLRPRRRRVALALVAVVALALPALAVSGRLGDLFGFSTEGTRVNASDFDPHLASHLSGVGADGDIRRLAVRDGLAFYAARSQAGALCLSVAPVERPEPRGISGSSACMPPETAKRFPSPELPVWSATAYMSPPGGPSHGVFVTRLVGFAADGVATVEVVAKEGAVITKVPVANNVFAASGLPQVPINALVARDAAGNVVWSESHRAPIARSRQP